MQGYQRILPWTVNQGAQNYVCSLLLNLCQHFRVRRAIIGFGEVTDLNITTLSQCVNIYCSYAPTNGLDIKDSCELTRHRR
jgi:hypothetical protein